MKVMPNQSTGTQPMDHTKRRDQNQQVPSSQASTTAPEQSARIELSDNAKLMKTAIDSVKAADTDRSSKIAELKKAIQNGTYKPDSKQVADKLVDHHLLFDFGKNRI